MSPVTWAIFKLAVFKWDWVRSEEKCLVRTATAVSVSEAIRFPIGPTLLQHPALFKTSYRAFQLVYLEFTTMGNTQIVEERVLDLLRCYVGYLCLPFNMTYLCRKSPKKSRKLFWATNALFKRSQVKRCSTVSDINHLPAFHRLYCRSY